MPPKKKLVLTVFPQEHVRPNWKADLSGPPFLAFVAALARELKPFGISVGAVENPLHLVRVDSYADLLNAVRITSADDGIHNRCVGHILGKSERLDVYDDIRAAVRRVAFAPETIPPDNPSKVCHNCGCGC